MLRLYIAGKVSKDSVFGTHHWRDDFCAKLEELSGIKLHNLDPTKLKLNNIEPKIIFGADSYLISQCDAVVVYLSDDISVGGSQEILIAKYFNKPVIGLAPKGGKFNGSRKEHFGEVVNDFKDPFVFTTCDIVCENIEDVAKVLANVGEIATKGIGLIDEATKHYLSQYHES